MKTMHKVRFVSALSLAAAGVTFAACAPRFRTECPEGKVQVGNGDVNEVCKYPDAGGAGGEGGSAGTAGGGAGGSTPVMGSGGAGGGVEPIPPGGVCNPKATKCEGDAQQTCDDAGQWGEAVACDIACDAGGKACVVPVQLAAGSDHACALLSDSTVRCWGTDALGQLGNSTTGDALKPKAVDGLTTAVDVVANANTTCARLSDGSATCWGSNSRRQILPTTATVVETPTALPGASNIKQIAIGSAHICVLNEQKVMTCKGWNEYGQIGNDSLASTEDVFVAPLNMPSPVKDIQAFGLSTLALLEDTNVYCWGLTKNCGGADDGNANTQYIGRPSKVPSVTLIKSLSPATHNSLTSSSIASSCVVRIDGQLSCWGANELGQLGRGSNTIDPLNAGLVTGLTGISLASSGTRHACAVTGSNELFCWGSNAGGALGVTCGGPVTCQDSGGKSFVPTATKVDLPAVATIQSGNEFSCALTTDAKVYCWGVNAKGQLGIGSTSGGETTPKAVAWK